MVNEGTEASDGVAINRRVPYKPREARERETITCNQKKTSGFIQNKTAVPFERSGETWAGWREDRERTSTEQSQSFAVVASEERFMGKIQLTDFSFLLS
jgi:hypothetical protein